MDGELLSQSRLSIGASQEQQRDNKEHDNQRSREMTGGAIVQSVEAQTSRGKMTNYRWMMIALGFLIIIVNYLDRSAISYAITDINKEFGLNNEQFGWILGAFGIGYVVMTLGGGILVDRWGARKIWSLSAIAWSVCTALLGIATGYHALFALRVALGVTEGPCFPSLTRVVTDWLPMSERGRSTAIGLAAVPLASVVGAPLVTQLIAAVGWKVMFFILGGFGIAWSVVWYYMFRDYPENSPHVSDSELRHIREGAPIHKDKSDDELRQHHLAAGTTTWKFMLLNPSLMSNNYAFFAFGYLLFFAVGWLPGYLEQTYAMKIKEVGLYLIAPWLTAAVMLTAGGFLSDYLWKKTGSVRVSRSHVIWVCQLLSALCFIPVTMTNSPNTAIFLISLGLGFGLMPNAAFYALNSDLAKDRAATSLGLMDCFLAAAAVMAPVLTGTLSKATGNFSVAIWLMVGFTLTSVLAVALFQKPDRDVLK